MTERRLVLQVAAVSALGISVLPGCSRQSEPAAPPATPDAQQTDEAALIALYDAALTTAVGTDRELLQRIRDDHAAHLQALGWQDEPPSTSPPPSPSTARLRRAELRAMRSRTQAARSAPDAQQAQVLALIAASEAQHAAVLEGS